MNVRLNCVALRIIGGKGIVACTVSFSLHLRSSMGLPVGKHIGPFKLVPVNDELVWDNKTVVIEPCIDRIADTIGKVTATGPEKDCLCFIEVIVHRDDTSKELLQFGSRVAAANSLRAHSSRHHLISFYACPGNCRIVY